MKAGFALSHSDATLVPTFWQMEKVLASKDFAGKRLAGRPEIRSRLELPQLHRRAVSQDFGGAFHELCGIVAHADDGIRSGFAGMLNH